MKLDDRDHRLERLGWRALGVVTALAGFLGGWWLTDGGFGSIQALRQLERVPVTVPGAVVAGEAALRGYAEPVQGTVNSTHTGTPSIHFRFLHEVEERDSDGDTHWRTVEDTSRAVNFDLIDESGRIRVHAGDDARFIDFDAKQRFRVTRGRDRYTEWRIEPRDHVFAFGKALERRNGGLDLHFSVDGQYTPIISSFDGFTARADMGLWGVGKLWAGLALLALGAWGVVAALRMHRVLVFVGLLGTVLGIALLDLGLRMMEDDLANALQRYASQEEASAERMKRSFAAAGDFWPGWEVMGELTPAHNPLLEARELTNLREVRFNLAITHARIADLFARVPEKWLAPLLGLELPPAPKLPPVEAAEVMQRVEAFQPTRLEGTWVWIASTVGLLLALGMSWWGIRQVRVKRCIENLPTSRTAGAACGLVELIGRVTNRDDEEPLVSPLESHHCCWYHYKVEERRGSGKDAKWVTIEDRTESQRFLLEDDEGTLLIDPKRSEVITHHKSTRRNGDLRYTERALLIGEEIYALGLAVVDRFDPSRLRVVKGESGDPFILSNYPENMIMMKKARVGLIALNVAFTGLLLALLLMFASSGSFAATDFLLAALAAPVYLFVVMVVLHYNDLLFLRERARRNWSNIEISLRKRHNLVPVLERLVKRYLAHERDLLESVTRMRTQLPGAIDDPEAAARFLAAERQLDERFHAVIENYPKLKGAKVVQKLSGGLTNLENEIALMRAGYNDAVEQYNARIATFPDVLLARAASFHRMGYVAL